MIDAEQSERLLRFFENMLSFYRDFLTFEREKHGIILSGDFAKLDAALRREQAFTLKARGMESDRQKLLAETGAGGGTFRELIPQVEPSRQEAMQKLYKDLSAVIGDIRRTNERSSRTIRMKMGRVSKALSNLEGHPELKQVYGGKPGQKAGPESTFSKKV